MVYRLTPVSVISSLFIPAVYEFKNSQFQTFFHVCSVEH